MEQILDNAKKDINLSELPPNSLKKDLFSLMKIGIVNSNILTTFTGIWLAIRLNNLDILQSLPKALLALIGSSLIIAGSCVINNFYDRDIDPYMERTKNRPTVTGSIKPLNTILLGIALLIAGFITLSFTTMMAVVYAFIGAFSYIVLYTMWTKRHYTLNTVIGSISGAVPPLIGWAAIDPNLHFVAWMLFLVMFIWQPPHFLALAMRRTEEYRAAGIPMLPVVYGFEITKRQVMIWILCLLPLPFYLHQLGLPFIILASLLNIGWIVLGIYCYRTKDDEKFSKLMFIYSLNYLTILFISMIVFTLPF
ncbi:heme o synthase [Bacillus sp. RG28]|uniref:Protoheme IX farnesyltransferase n=1 Tax=Gottfriedia endophytica TaxID=2820819 RepID=A0A940NPY2_9BACI|nr:heme o synthase [Gottfriedia endophytica]MBP0724777.1 heme o synthase [Gottfriedia endophytica]